MNRWLKYGGIMPEIINISNIEYTLNYFLTDSGGTSLNNDFKYTKFILDRGKYKFRFFINNDYTRSARYRVLQYDINDTFIQLLDAYSTQGGNKNTIITLVGTINQKSIIGLSMIKNASLLGVEKL